MFDVSNVSVCVSAGMLTITDFINILHRYYKSPLVSSSSEWYLCIKHSQQINT